MVFVLLNLTHSSLFIKLDNALLRRKKKDNTNLYTSVYHDECLCYKLQINCCKDVQSS